MKVFNINEYIYVKLTDRGKNILNNYYADFDWKPTPNEEGYYKFQMWQFMNLFGNHFSMGTDNITINNNVYFKEEDLI